MNYADALEYLDSHINLETGIVHDATVPVIQAGRMANPPSLDRMRRLVSFLGEPQEDLDLVHITGTNGKGSTARMVSALLHEHGMSVGTYTSPHLVRPNERIAIGGEPIDNDEFADMVRVLQLAEIAAGQRNSWFELVTAGAFRWFSDMAVQAGVIEVGAGGRWDATNVCDGAVSVITNIDLDHQQWFGDTKGDIAREKVGIVKPNSIVVIGDEDPDIVSYLETASLDAGASVVWTRGVDFACDSNRLALGGRICTLRTATTSYPGVFLPCHGAHQGENASIALAAAEAFVGSPLDDEVVKRGFSAVVNPGRMEVVGRDPLIVLDGAHNPAGARVAARTLSESFAANPHRIYVVGLLNQRDPVEMLDALGVDSTSSVIAVAPASPRALEPQLIAAAATSLGASAVVARSVEAALDHAVAEATEDSLVFVAGSLYIVGEARSILRP